MPLRFLAVLLITSLGASFPAFAAELQPFTAVYEASFSGLGVTAKRELTGKENNWRLDFSADSMFADIREYSRFSKDNGQLTPHHYEYQKTGLGRDRRTALNFEPDQRRVINLTNASRTLENAPDKIQDKISYQLQLAMDVAAGKDKLEYRVADGRKIREYEFAIAGEETIQTPLGAVKTIKVQRVREGDAERETNIWFAPAWNYALVKLQQQEDDGKNYQISLTELTIDGKSVNARQ